MEKGCIGWWVVGNIQKLSSSDWSEKVRAQPKKMSVVIVLGKQYFNK
jgi:hypothetical protein